MRMVPRESVGHDKAALVGGSCEGVCERTERLGGVLEDACGAQVELRGDRRATGDPGRLERLIDDRDGKLALLGRGGEPVLVEERLDIAGDRLTLGLLRRLERFCLQVLEAGLDRI